MIPITSSLIQTIRFNPSKIIVLNTSISFFFFFFENQHFHIYDPYNLYLNANI